MNQFLNIKTFEEGEAFFLGFVPCPKEGEAFFPDTSFQVLSRDF